ncbi:TVP38/TMEM64 family protein [Yoonia sp.]|uniref:TVP38/TMEM64 family protein n=1 Tax=Yoonia sp. TaxID=2212373 RepID=UPI0023B43539
MLSKSPNLRRLAFWLLAFAAIAAVAAWALGYMPQIERETIEGWIAAAGPWGPALIIVLMVVAVVASPIPSAPVALVSGAAYGHLAGAIYVAIGSELGALLAFVIARYLGREQVERWLGDKATYGLLGSQNLLMLTVFGSRLLPFISFDAMSYAAGLSRLHLWRFLLATLAGILPASFLLAHFGAEAMSGEFGTAEWIAIGLGLMTVTPLILGALWHRNGRT